jgi:PilZ domain
VLKKRRELPMVVYVWREAMRAETALIPEPAVAPDRRRHTRYRRCAPLTVRAKEGQLIPAMTIEISVTGLSAVLSSPINVGDFVELSPIAGGTVRAQARHNVGKVYGFQFFELAARRSQKIAKECCHLPIYSGNHLGI